MSASIEPLELVSLRLRYRPKHLLLVVTLTLCLSGAVLGLASASLGVCSKPNEEKVIVGGVIVHGLLCLLSLIGVVLLYHVKHSRRELRAGHMRVFTFYLGIAAVSSCAWGGCVVGLVSVCMLCWTGGILSLILGCMLLVPVLSKLWKRSYFGWAIEIYYCTRKIVWVIHKVCCWKHKDKFLYVVEDRGGETKATFVTVAPQEEGTVRFVCISDTHLTHWQLAIPNGDVLVHTGDILQYDRGTSQDVRGRNDGVETLSDFNDWLGTLKSFKYRLAIAGNHDRTLHELGPARVQEILTNATYLCDDWVQLTFPERVNSHPITVFGSPMSAGHSDNCAFQLSRDDMIKRLRGLLARDTDILMTHYMPFSAAESPGIPRYHICGHDHMAYGVAALKHANGKDFAVVNGAVCNHHYCPSHPPIVFDFHFG